MIRRASRCPVVYCCHDRWASLSANELPISLWADNDPATTTCLPYVFPTCHITRNCILACWSLTVWYYWLMFVVPRCSPSQLEEWVRDRRHSLIGPLTIHNAQHCDRAASCSSFSSKTEHSRLCPIFTQSSDHAPHSERENRTHFSHHKLNIFCLP